MSSRSLVWVVVVAAALVAVAWFVTSRRTPVLVEDAPSAREPWLPELRERLRTDAASIDRIEIERGDRRTVLARSPEGWVLPDKASYAADPARVDAILRSLGALERDQPLTTDPARFGELGLAWPDAKSEATSVRVLAGSTPVIDVIVGRTKFTPPSVYVRRAGSNETWRCAGQFAAEADAARLMKPVVAEIPAASIASIEWGPTVLRRTETGTWEVESGGREEGEAPESGAPPGDAAKTGDFARVLPELFTRLEMDDVRAATGVPAERTAKAAVGDRTVLFELLPSEGEAALPTGAPPGQSSPRWYRVTVGDPEPGLAAAAPPEETVKMLEEIKLRVAGREFRLPSWKAGRLVALPTGE